MLSKRTRLDAAGAALNSGLRLSAPTEQKICIGSGAALKMAISIPAPQHFNICIIVGAMATHKE